MRNIVKGSWARVITLTLGALGALAPAPRVGAEDGTASVTSSSPYGTATSTKDGTVIRFYLSVSSGTIGPVRFVGGVLFNNNPLARYNMTGDYGCGSGQRLAFTSRLNVSGYTTISATCPAGTTLAGGRLFVTLL